MIKNYTSQVPASQSIYRIEKRLVDNGATTISKFYDDKGKIEGVIFQMKVPEAPMPITFKLPARVDRVFDRLWKEVKKPSPERKDKVKDQAERTAWKLLNDWIDIQMSLIELNQIDFTEVFLSYAYDGQQTYHEKLMAGGTIKLLSENNIA